VSVRREEGPECPRELTAQWKEQAKPKTLIGKELWRSQKKKKELPQEWNLKPSTLAGLRRMDDIFSSTGSEEEVFWEREQPCAKTWGHVTGSMWSEGTSLWVVERGQF
jgi:hypothetical protein